MFEIKQSMNKHKILEWNEAVLQLENSRWSILVCSIGMNYVHKISTKEAGDVYLVSEQFYQNATAALGDNNYTKSKEDK